MNISVMALIIVALFSFISGIVAFLLLWFSIFKLFTSFEKGEFNKRVDESLLTRNFPMLVFFGSELSDTQRQYKKQTMLRFSWFLISVSIFLASKRALDVNSLL